MFEDATSSPSFEYAQRELGGGRFQQVIAPSVITTSFDSTESCKQEHHSQSEITQNFREKEDQNYVDFTLERRTQISEAIEKSCLFGETLGTQVMGEIVEEVDVSAAEVEKPKIGVAVGKSRSSLDALKWALDNVVSSGGVVYLLHVQAPLRFIPTPMGNNLPVEQISEDIVNKFKMQRFTETEKLLDQYRRMCNKRQVKPEVCYSEGDSVQKELVDQISNLSIAKLVLGTSSHSLFAKAFKGPGISSFVAKHAPDFCTVLVVDKGKLYSVRDAAKSVTSHLILRTSTSSLSDSSVSNGDISEEDTISRRNIQSASEDLSNTPARWLPLHDSRNTRGFYSPPAAILQSSFSGPTGGRNFRSAPQTPLLYHQDQQTVIKYPSVDIVQSSEDMEGRFPQEQVPDSNGQACEDTERSPAPMVASSQLMTEASIGENGGSSNTSDKDLEHFEVTPVSDMDTFFEITWDRGPDNPNSNEGQLPPQLLQTNLQGSISAVPEYEDIMADDVQELKRQLEKATLSARLAQTEAVIHENRCKQKEDVIASARKRMSQYEAQRIQDLQAREDALRDAHTARQQAANEARRCEEVLVELEEAKEMIKVALEQQEICRQKAAEEASKHQETLAALEESRRMAEGSIMDAEVARQLAAAETRKYEEAMEKLDEARKALELEARLRREAEEKALQEAVAKQEALAALRKSQQRYIKYSFEELQAATNNFQEEHKLGEGGFGSVYKGKLHHTTVAIKVLKREGLQGQQEFQREVELLSRIHHPHMVMLLGACPERACIVYEYMANGNLEDRLNCKDGTPPLPWYVRFRICSEVATGLMFLHSRPEPIVHRDLKPGNILLDHNLVSKISDVGLARLVPNNLTFSMTMYRDTVPVGTFAYIDPDYQRTGVVSRESDVYALGIVMLQLLTGRPALGVTNLVEEAVDNGRLDEVLDKSAGEWPLPEAMELACLSLQCAEPKRKHRPDLETRVIGALENIRMVAEAAAATEANVGSSSLGREPIIPSFFICPISQEIMEDPYIAADGFTYEREVIQAWLNAHNTSPMTNLRLNHKNLIPNHSLRSAIREWNAQNGIRHD